MKEQITLKELRYCKLRMTQAEFAEALGVSRRTVARYEATGAPPTILKLAAHLLKYPPQRAVPARPAEAMQTHT